MKEYLDYLEKLNTLVDKDEILFKSASAIVIKERKRLWDWFDALSENSGFRRALLATHNAVLTHSIGKKNPSETILTRNEFCSRLTKIRARLQQEGD